MVTQKDLESGDIILFRVKTSSGLSAKFIAWGQKVIGMAPSKSSYSHVALVDLDTDLIIEARWPKVKISTIDWTIWNKEYDIQLFRVKKVTEIEIQQATLFAKSCVGEWYDLPSFLFGWIQFKHTQICSTLAANSWKAAKRYFKTENNGFVTPDMIAADPLIWRVK